MTVGDLTALLQRKMTIDPTLRDKKVIAEGCDCANAIVGVTRLDDNLILRIEDGTFSIDASTIKLEVERS
jgi:hypothetical protein